MLTPQRWCRNIARIATPSETESAADPADHATTPTTTSADALSVAEIDAIESELAQVERSLELLTDDDVDPTAALAWMDDDSPT